MEALEFNNKWKNYLNEGHYGLNINIPQVTEYLDSEFEKEIKINELFNYSQIKLKYGFARVYANTDKVTEWENMINKIINLEL
jgi:predicted Zn-dependent protease